MCQTMNGMWGYKVADTDYKSSRQLITLLERAAAKGSNLLLNIGPQPNGELPAVALERLHDIGQWMQRYGESIYGTSRGAEFAWGVTTVKADRTYLHVLQSATSVTLPLQGKPRTVARMADGKQLDWHYDQRHKTLSVYGTAQYDVIIVTR